MINFRLRRDYTGATVGYEYDTPTRSGGGQTNNVWASLGIGDLKKDRYNLSLNFQYKNETTLLAAGPQLLETVQPSALLRQRRHAERQPRGHLEYRTYLLQLPRPGA